MLLWHTVGVWMVWKCCNHALKAVTPGDIGVLCRKQWKMLRSYSSLVINCNNFKFGFTWIVVVMNKCPFLVGTSHSGHWMTRCVSGVSVVLWRSVPALLRLCVLIFRDAVTVWISSGLEIYSSCTCLVGCDTFVIVIVQLLSCRIFTVCSCLCRLTQL